MFVLVYDLKALSLVLNLSHIYINLRAGTKILLFRERSKKKEQNEHEKFFLIEYNRITQTA